jgi:hypothetical protein
MSVVTQLYFQIFEENNYMFRPFSVWAIIRLRLEYRRKHIYYNVDIKNGGTRSCFTIFGVVCNYICAMWNGYDFVCRVLCRSIDSSPHVNGPTEDIKNKVVTIPLRAYIATHLSKHCKMRSRSPILDVHIVVHVFSPIF